MSSLTFAIKFFTHLPWPGKVKWEPTVAARSLGALPLVGLLLGAGLSAVSYVMDQTFISNLTPLLKAALLMLGEWWLGGSLFLDGFADTCDGIFSGAKPDRALEIMKDSRIGAMGAIGLNLAFILKLALLDQLLQLTGWPMWKLLLFYPCWSKWMVGMIVFWLPTAKNEGLAFFFHHKKEPAAWWLGTACMALAAALLLPGPLFTAVLLVSGLAVLLVAVWLQSRLGGQTGDTYGFLSQVAELSFLWLTALALIK